MSLVKLSLFLLFCVCCEAQLRKEAFMTVPNLIRAAGYPIEKHRVTTQDGYVLQMHRIPAGRRSARRTGDPGAKGKKAILIVHGLIGSSGDFVIMGPERSLAYLLADYGYDVWLGNLRGTVYSTHRNLTRSDPKFWEFSFHEHGKHDLPTMVDGVLNVTGLPKVMFVGYSMGTTSFFTMMALKPEYNDKVISFVALAPAVFMDNIRPLATLFMNLDFANIMRSQGTLSLDPQVLQRLIAALCNPRQPEYDLCTNVLFTLVGEDYEQNDVEMMPIYMHRIQPAAWRQLEHFAKIAITGVFQTWSGGLAIPGKPYNLTNVKVPVSLLYGENDQLTDKIQIMRLADQLKSTGTLEDVRPGCSWPKFNHLDFVFAKDVGTLFNKPLIKHIDTLYNKYGPE
ncbi:lipase 1-like [Trichoplusia ni]|uniref:Lipase n=1 Tax=Trichoplusia ni TaxID=7111 RepID=A0A7E5W8D4_TRINI|nr:lipase 1-like [Trichoplusia ni]